MPKQECETLRGSRSSLKTQLEAQTSQTVNLQEDLRTCRANVRNNLSNLLKFLLNVHVVFFAVNWATYWNKEFSSFYSAKSWNYNSLKRRPRMRNRYVKNIFDVVMVIEYSYPMSLWRIKLHLHSRCKVSLYWFYYRRHFKCRASS